ncbi:hypothetical protein ACFY4C_21455 [Actinomadura viridis]|uniref:hypothetical protein n=1 Tax=Actinomadura viridis TaxID=58110 RepID=UPI003697DD37
MRTFSSGERAARGRPFSARGGSRTWLRWTAACAIALLPVLMMDGRGAVAAKRSLPAAGVNTNIDGFPVLFNETGANAGLKLWVIGHHGYAPGSAPKISCVDVATGALCPVKNGVGTWPLPLNTRAIPFNTGTAGDISTSQLVQFVTDPSRTKVFYPAVTRTASPGYPNGSVGAGCLDLQNQYNCAYTPLAPLTNTAGQSNVNGLTGFVRANSQLHGVTTSGQVVCMNTSNQQPCNGQPYAGGVPPNEDVADLAGQLRRLDDGRQRAALHHLERAQPGAQHQPARPDAVVLRTGTAAPCAGWDTKVLTTSADAYISTSVFPAYNASGTVTGVCTVTGKQSVASPTVACFDLSGAAMATPPGLADVFPGGGMGSVSFQPTSLAIGGNLRTYFPFYSQDSRYPGAALCYNWSTQARCTQFPSPNRHPGVNGGNVRDYAYVGGVNCLYGSGDRRYVFSMNPATGEHGC